MDDLRTSEHTGRRQRPQPRIAEERGREAAAQDTATTVGRVVTLAICELAGIDSPRLDGVDQDYVNTLARLSIDRLPPIVVHHDSMRVIDGAHRLAAAQLNGRDSIDARLFQGSTEEAFRLSVRLNLAHGLPLPVADRRIAAERILQAQPHLSDRAVAAATGLAAGTVADIRLALGPRSEVHARIGQDGRSRPLNTAEGRERAGLVIAENPHASLRQIARAAGISVGTARDVRSRVLAGQDPVPHQQRHAGPSAAGGHDAPSTADVLDLFRVLSRDPTLRYTEQGRSLLRWIERRMLVTAQWLTVPALVPPHCAGTVADIARACAASWSDLADQLDVGGA